MKILKKLCLIWIMITILSCETVKYIEVPVKVYEKVNPTIIAPPEREYLEPQREEESLNLYLFRRVNYYKDLAESWESWGIQVYESVDQELPESLLLGKKTTESNSE